MQLRRLYSLVGWLDPPCRTEREGWNLDFLLRLWTGNTNMDKILCIFKIKKKKKSEAFKLGKKYMYHRCHPNPIIVCLVQWDKYLLRVFLIKNIFFYKKNIFFKKNCRPALTGQVRSVEEQKGDSKQKLVQRQSNHCFVNGGSRLGLGWASKLTSQNKWSWLGPLNILCVFLYFFLWSSKHLRFSWHSSNSQSWPLFFLSLYLPKLYCIIFFPC
jgi:hypothetical protein